MVAAEVGDDVFQQDPTVNALEAKGAAMFGKAAALFCPSGTMSNQIALSAHTQRLDEVICEEYSHIYQYETGGYAANSGLAINTIKGQHGKMTAAQVEAAIKPLYDWLPKSSLVVLENTCNKGGGSYYTLEEIKPIRQLCLEKNMKLHLDGARIFNALVETGESTLAVGEQFDSISICMSKGLGAPVGSILIGEEDFIRKARRVRKVMGGGMRQAGYLAAACIFALENNIERLKTDNARARKLGKALETMPFVASVRPVKTNIVIFDLKDPHNSDSFLAFLKEKGIEAAPFGPQTIRFVTHLDLDEAMIDEVVEVLKSFTGMNTTIV